MLDEPTIEQIERLLAAFREQGGKDAEINLIAQDIIREYRPETVKPLDQVFEKESHPTIEKIIAFKNDNKKPITQAWRDFWSKWYYKYPIIFTLVFFGIFATSNLPLYFTKLKPTTDTPKETVSKVVVNNNETSAPLEPGEVIADSPTLVVPKISVTAPIQFVNSTNEAETLAVLPNGVVHYYQTALPGQVGNTFLTGHSSNYWWIKGDYNYIFANLDKLTVGDQAKIYYAGNKYLYQVTSVSVVEPTDLSVLDQTITPTLTLMTCTPPGTSWKRLIVKFDQISPIYQAPKLVTLPSVNSSGTLPKADSNPVLDWLAKLFGL